LGVAPRAPAARNHAAYCPVGTDRKITDDVSPRYLLGFSAISCPIDVKKRAQFGASCGISERLQTPTSTISRTLVVDFALDQLGTT